MITKDNLDTLLSALQFQKDMIDDVWGRTFSDGTDLKVNTATEKFLYKEAGITVTGATTANFSQKENFADFGFTAQYPVNKRRSAVSIGNSK